MRKVHASIKNKHLAFCYVAFYFFLFLLAASYYILGVLLLFICTVFPPIVWYCCHLPLGWLSKVYSSCCKLHASNDYYFTVRFCYSYNYQKIKLILLKENMWPNLLNAVPLTCMILQLFICNVIWPKTSSSCNL